jgi:hypothetical protein
VIDLGHVTEVLGTICVGVIAFFLKRTFKSLDHLTEAVDGLKINMAEINGKISGHVDLQKNVMKHEREIIIIDSKTKAAHKRLDDLIASKH